MEMLIGAAAPTIAWLAASRIAFRSASARSHGRAAVAAAVKIRRP